MDYIPIFSCVNRTKIGLLPALLSLRKSFPGKGQPHLQPKEGESKIPSYQSSPLEPIPMPNINAVLREEICRLAKREIKASTSSTKSAVAQYRRDIAALKRQMRASQKDIAFLKAQEKKRLGQPQKKDEEDLEGVRFSARSAKAQRERLGLSQQTYAKLVGVSPMTIYNWESGKGRPNKEGLAALVAVRGIGKREALAKLEAMKVKTLRKKKPK